MTLLFSILLYQLERSLLIYAALRPAVNFLGISMGGGL